MSILSYIRHHAVVTTVSVLVIIIVMVIAGRAATSKKPTDIIPSAKVVTVVNASMFRNGTSTISVQGVVESRSQADLKSQISAPVSVVYAAVGDSVVAGQTLVELQNADIRAQLESARASLTLAKGQYVSSRQSAIDKIRDAYIKGDDAVHSQADRLILSNTGHGAPVFIYMMPKDYQIGNEIRDISDGLDRIFIDWRASVYGISASSSDERIHDVVVQSQKNLASITRLLDDIAQVFNNAASTASGTYLDTLNGYLAIVTAARNSVSAAQTSLTSAESLLGGSRTAQGSAAEAGVSVAEAGVRNLEAQLAKTIIRSPISGKISALPLHVGEFAAPGQLIATVVGGGGLHVKSFASSEDVSRIAVGAPVVIQGKVKGTVTGVAPSVSSSNKKAEVTIDIIDPYTSQLVVGDNVQAAIQAQKGSVASYAYAGQHPYLVPIQNVKIIPGAAFVFTVDLDSKIKRNDVVLGQVRGDFVEVISGLADDMSIVSPVYELEEGQSVTVQ